MTAPTKGVQYSRSDICGFLGLPYPNSDSERAVLVGKGIVAIVINQSGRTPAGPPFWNELANGVLKMEGRDDLRGDLLEKADYVLLFYRWDKTHKHDKYTFEGPFEYASTQPVTMIRTFAASPSTAHG